VELKQRLLAFGGETPAGTTVNATTEEYDGSDLDNVLQVSSTARKNFGAAAGTTQAAGLAAWVEKIFLARSPSKLATEEWTGAGPNNSYNHSFLTLYLFI
jgi:hypothetical protein